jgi:hypothetical protein
MNKVMMSAGMGGIGARDAQGVGGGGSRRAKTPSAAAKFAANAVHAKV